MNGVAKAEKSSASRSTGLLLGGVLSTLSGEDEEDEGEVSCVDGI